MTNWIALAVALIAVCIANIISNIFGIKAKEFFESKPDGAEPLRVDF